MHRITPHLWFDTEAVEAAAFYAATFPDSHVTDVTTIRGTPSGDTDVVSFTVCGQPFVAISAGPLFTFNPSISFAVACDTTDEVDALWEVLSDGGEPLMPLGSYPFSERYGWTEDRYGLSWQIIHAGERDVPQRITPTLMFTGDVHGKAEEAIGHYTSIFSGADIGDVFRYGADEDPDPEGTIKYASFRLEGQTFAAMDSARVHGIGFNEAISLMISCDTQEDIDRYWDALTAVPEAERCGWLKDRYGISWQVVPVDMEEMLRTGTDEQIARVTAAFLEMKKFDLAELEAARVGATSTKNDTTSVA